MRKKKYGVEHREAKQEKAIRTEGEQECQVTGKKECLNAHHNVPKFFNGPDMSSNYIMLDESFHRYLHYICNVTKNNLVGQRIMLTNKISKHIHDDSKVLDTLREMDKVDDKLIPEYIHNMMHGMPESVQELLTFHSLVSCFKTIRDMRVKIMQLEAKGASVVI